MNKILASAEFAKDRGLKHSLRHEFQSWRPAERRVVAAVCYRQQANGEIEFLLVRTRAGRWTFPKGGIDGDPTAAIAAAREAHEEAGVHGQVEARAFTWYVHYKNGSCAHTVNAHLCRVAHLEAPRESYRTPRWYSPDAAKRRLREARPVVFAEELERVVDQAIRRVEARTLRSAFSHIN